MLPKTIAMVVLLAGTVGCQRVRPTVSSNVSISPDGLADRVPDAAMVGFVSFDEVTEKVWDADRKARSSLPPVDKEILRRTIRSAVRACVCPNVTRLSEALRRDLYLSLRIHIDTEGKYETTLGRFLNHTEEPKSKVSQELTKMENCLERYLRANGYDRKSLAGRPLELYFPFNHGLPCEASDDG